MRFYSENNKKRMTNQNGNNWKCSYMIIYFFTIHLKLHLNGLAQMQIHASKYVTSKNWKWFVGKGTLDDFLSNLIENGYSLFINKRFMLNEMTYQSELSFLLHKFSRILFFAPISWNPKYSCEVEKKVLNFYVNLM